MSKIYVTRNENQLVFSTKPVQYDSEFKTILSRPAFLAFARWLKQNVQEEDLKSEIVIYGFLNRYKHDLREDRVRWLRCIKSIKDEDLYRELGLKRAASHCPSVQDRDFAFEIPVYYIEDFYQLLLLMGYDEKKAAEFTWAATCGYKSYCRQNAWKDQLISVSEELHEFAKLADGLPSRNWIRKVFKHEWTRFEEYQEQCRVKEERERMKKGLFWFIDRNADPPKFITVSADCDATGNALDSTVHFSSKSGANFNHAAEWQRLPKEVTQGKPYNYYPRGRVEVRDGKVTIFLNPVLNEERIVRAIKDAFDLKEGGDIKSIRVISDGSRHYQCEEDQ